MSARVSGGLAFGGGCLVTIAYAIGGAGYISDDYYMEDIVRNDGVIDAMVFFGFEAPARPLMGPYFAILYGVLPHFAGAQWLLLAAVNGLATLALWVYTRRTVGVEIGIYATAVFILLPNHSAVRFWHAGGNIALAVALVLLAAVCLHAGRSPWLGGALLVAGMLVYEAVFGLAIGLIGCWLIEARFVGTDRLSAMEIRRRVRVAAVMATMLTVAALTAYLRSPKRVSLEQTGPGWPDRQALDGLLGEGLTGASGLGVISLVVVAGACAWGVASFLPSFGANRSDIDRGFRFGAVLLVSSTAPLIYVGREFGVSGVFDRDNYVPSVGIVLLIGSVWALAASRFRTASHIAAVALLMWLASATIDDLGEYRDAVARGDALVEELVRNVDPSGSTVIVVPPLENWRNLEAFIYPADLAIALTWFHGEEWRNTRMPWTTGACVEIAEESLASGHEVVVYDRRTGGVSSSCEAVGGG